MMALVISHRGAGALAPENTLEGIRAAALCRADYVELDIRLSRDGELVLMHDESVDRTTNGKGLVEELDLKELKALRVRGQEIPTLRRGLNSGKKAGSGPGCGDEGRGPGRAGGRGPVRQQLHCDILLSQQSIRNKRYF